MNLNVKAKKGTGLDNIFKGYTPQQLEEITKTVSNPAYHDALRQYQVCLEHQVRYEWLIENEEFLKNQKVVLSPSEINHFLHATIAYEEHPNYELRTGKYITKLIQDSYDAGCNDFHLDTTALKPLSLSSLQGQENNPLQVFVWGNVGGYLDLTFDPKYIYLEVHGNSNGWVGWKADKSIFIIHGKHSSGGDFRSAKNCILVSSNDPFRAFKPDNLEKGYFTTAKGNVLPTWKVIENAIDNGCTNYFLRKESAQDDGTKKVNT